MLETLMRVNGISKNFGTSAGLSPNVLTDISLELFKGEILGLIGENGAGKTVLSSIIATLETPSSGAILFKKRDGSFVSIFDDIISYRRQLGFCPQKQNLIDTLSVRETLIFSGKYYYLKTRHAQKRADELINKYNLSDFKNEPISNLSESHRQRCMLARALVHNPRFIILDEPTIGLDLPMRTQFFDEMQKLKEEGITIMLTTHYIEELESLFDRICILNHGKIELIGTPDELKKIYQCSHLKDIMLSLTKTN